jgi:hypothetical protein
MVDETPPEEEGAALTRDGLESELASRYPAGATVEEIGGYVRSRIAEHIQWADDETDIAIQFVQHLDDASLLEVGLREGEYSDKILRELIRRLRADKGERRDFFLSALAQIASRCAEKGAKYFAAVFIRSAARFLSRQDLLEVIGRLDRRTCHHQHLERLAGDIGRTMVTERPLAAHADLLRLTPESLQGLDGGSLLLIGGGPQTPLAQELADEGLRCAVTNVDPAATEQPGVTAVRGPFTDVPLAPGAFTEAWAVHSLPTYALMEDVGPFYERALRSLRQGGALRVCPVTDFREGVTPLLAVTRPFACDLSMACIDLLRSRPDLFEVSVYTIEHDLSYLKGKNPDKILGREVPDSVTLTGATVRVRGAPAEVSRFLDAHPFDAAAGALGGPAGAGARTEETRDPQP